MYTSVWFFGILRGEEFVGNVRDRTLSLHIRYPTLVDALVDRSDRNGATRAFTFLADGESTEENISYAELDRAARACAALLQQQGVRPGDRALLLYPPGIEYLVGFFGCLYAGVIAVPAYPPDPSRLQRTLPRIQAIVQDSGATFAMTTSQIVAMTDFLLGDAPDLQRLRWIATDSLTRGLEDDWSRPRVSPDSLAFLQYTSGSTGSPKGVVLSHRNLVHNSALISHAFNLSRDPVGVIWLPPYHDMGLIGGLLQPVYAAIPTVLISPLSFLQRPMRWLEAISRYGGTCSGGPNFAYELCVRKSTPEERALLDLSSWELAFSGAEPVRAATLARFAEAFGASGFRSKAFYPCYGLAEGTLIVSGGTRGEPTTVRTFDEAALQQRRAVERAADEPGTQQFVGCGTTLPDQEVLIVDGESGQRCPDGSIGEIWVSGPSVAQGYWRRDEETERTFGARVAGDDGTGPTYLRTGDLGFVAANELFIAGRLKDLIIIRGRNLYPQDIERVAEESHGAVRPGCGAAIGVSIDGQERLVLVLEFERRFRPDRRAGRVGQQSDDKRRTGSDRRSDNPNVVAFDGSSADQARRRTSPDDSPPPDPDEVIEAVRQAVAESFRVQPHAVLLIKAGTIPKTSSGKIQRHACRQAFVDGTLEPIQAWQARPSSRAPAMADTPRLSLAELAAAIEEDHPRHVTSDLTQWLLTQFARYVRLDPREIETRVPVTRYGLDSLRSIELLAEIESQLGVALPPEVLLSGATLNDIAERLLVAVSAGNGDAATGSVEDSATPLSFGQRALWFLWRLAPESSAYNVHSAVRIHTRVEVEALDRAVAAVLERHAILRTTVDDTGGEARQIVHESVITPFSIRNVTGWADEAVGEALETEARRPFDLRAGSVIRVTLFRRGAEDNVLLLVVHHIATDFWSLAILANEIAALYAAFARGEEASLRPLRFEYIDFARQQVERFRGDGQPMWGYWSEKLAGTLPVLSLPTDFPRPAIPSFRGASLTVRLDTAVTDLIKPFAASTGTTPFVTLLAVYSALLQRCTRQNDVIVGTPTAGRVRGELVPLVGYVVNPVPIRIDLTGEPSFLKLVERVRESVVGAIRNQEFPFPVLVERLNPTRSASHSPLFQTLFVLQQTQSLDGQDLAPFAVGDESARVRIHGLELSPVPIENRSSQFDLTLSVAFSGRDLVAQFEYNTDLFHRDTVQRIAGLWARLVEHLVRHADEPISRAPLLSSEERARLLPAPVDPTAGSVTFDRLFEAQAIRTPAALALQTPTASITYSELDRLANQWCQAFADLGVRYGDSIGVALDRGVDLVACFIGILRLGGVYVPLDPKNPPQRLGLIISDANISTVVTSATYEPLFRSIGVRCIGPDAATGRAPLLPAAIRAAMPAVSPDSVAYVMYTSGSTGRPKGVAIGHRSLANLSEVQARTFGIDASSRVLQQAPIGFDTSIEEMVVTLAAGGSLHIGTPDQMLPGPEMVRLLRERRISAVMSFTPAVLAAIPWAELPALRTVVCGGDACTAEIVRRWKPGRRFFNAYGPTEATVDALVYECQTIGDTPPPIGRAIRNTFAVVLDDQMGVLPPGIPGELYLGGVGIARGYVNRPDLTAERFVPDVLTGSPGARLYRTGDLVRLLPDGNIEFLGRVDSQVKIRGVRIEIAEIEAVLQQHPGIVDATVTVFSSAKSAKELAGYYVSVNGTTLAEADVFEHLRKHLPQFMIPSALVQLPALPLTLTGKVDRSALPVPQRNAAAGGQPPRTDTERKLAEVWRELLGVETISIESSFFDLGGHSLLAVQLCSRIISEFDVELPIRRVFDSPTIQELAAVIVEVSASHQERDSLEQLLGEIEQLSDEEAQSLLDDDEKVGSNG